VHRSLAEVGVDRKEAGIADLHTAVEARRSLMEGLVLPIAVAVEAHHTDLEVDRPAHHIAEVGERHIVLMVDREARRIVAAGHSRVRRVGAELPTVVGVGAHRTVAVAVRTCW